MDGCPELVKTSRTPKLLWYQSDNAIFIRILLVDVQKYSLKVEPDTLKFSAIVNETKYFVGLKLYGAVVPDKTSHGNSGRELKIVLIKAHKWTSWPRLQLHKEKNQLISADPDFVFKKFFDYDTSQFEGIYKSKLDSLCGRPPEDYASDTDSDDKRIISYD